MTTRRGRDTSTQPQARPAAFRFSTDDFPEDDKLTVWREIFGRTVCNLDIDPVAQNDFRAKATVSRFAGVGALVGSTTGVRLNHTRQLIVDDDLSFMTGPMPQWTAIQHGREASLGCGDGVLMNNAEVGSITMPSETQFVTFRVSVAEVAALVPDVGDLIARPVSGNSHALRLLTRYFEALREEDATPAAARSPELMRLVATHVHDLLALALGATRDAAHVAVGRGVRAARLQLILAEIRLRFAHPAFSPADLAVKFGVSTRYVQDLLHDTGISFSERVIELRLRKARDMLAGAGASSRKIIEIAFACGFGDISYFNRCFRRRFGAPPSAFRGEPGARADAASPGA